MAVRRIQLTTNIKVMCTMRRMNFLRFNRVIYTTILNYTVVKLLNLGMYATRVITGSRFKHKLKVKLICVIVSSISNLICFPYFQVYSSHAPL